MLFIYLLDCLLPVSKADRFILLVSKFLVMPVFESSGLLEEFLVHEAVVLPTSNLLSPLVAWAL